MGSQIKYKGQDPLMHNIALRKLEIKKLQHVGHSFSNCLIVFVNSLLDFTGRMY